MIPRVFAAAAPVLLVLGGSSCGAGWHRVETPAGGVRPRQQVQVWHDDRFERWHAVTVGPDSITGVPYWRAVGCDSCRLALPRPSVDSLRFGNPTAGFWKTVGLIVGTAAITAAVVCGSDGSGCVD
ncbi:MAG TPA: hypothetical protein VIG95_01395 [Gemmatimonadales bacterium]